MSGGFATTEKRNRVRQAGSLAKPLATKCIDCLNGPRAWSLVRNERPPEESAPQQDGSRYQRVPDLQHTGFPALLFKGLRLATRFGL